VPVDFDRAIPFMLQHAGSGKRMILGSVSTPCIFEERAVEVFDDRNAGSMGNAKTALIQRGSLPGIAIGSRVSIDGVEYDVRARPPVDEGALTRLFLKDVT